MDRHKGKYRPLYLNELDNGIVKQLMHHHKMNYPDLMRKLLNDELVRLTQPTVNQQRRQGYSKEQSAR